MFDENSGKVSNRSDDCLACSVEFSDCSIFASLTKGFPSSPGSLGIFPPNTWRRKVG